MKGNGNGWSTQLQKLYFMLIPSSGRRTAYINKHKHLFKQIGGGYFGNLEYFRQIQNSSR